MREPNPNDPSHDLANLSRVMLNLNLGADDDGVALDHTDLYQALEPILHRTEYIQLGAMLELCPLHHCDLQICLDDEVHGNEVYNVS